MTLDLAAADRAGRAGRAARRAARSCVSAAAFVGLVAVVGCGGGSGGGVPTFPGMTLGSVDVAPDPQAVTDSYYFETRSFTPSDCAVVEGSVVAGVRTLLRFDMVVVNYGQYDLVIGSPNAPVPPLTPADFTYSPCHQHYHFDGWADYTLMDTTLTTVVATGHKQAFCLLDSIPYSSFPPYGYDCTYQGISSGWADIYTADLDGQWVDVTGVATGDYMLVVTVNVDGKVVEAVDAHADAVAVPVHVP